MVSPVEHDIVPEHDIECHHDVAGPEGSLP